MVMCGMTRSEKKKKGKKQAREKNSKRQKGEHAAS